MRIYKWAPTLFSILIAFSGSLTANPTQLEGTLKRALCNPNTGKPHQDNQWESRFLFIQDGVSWRIAATNVALPSQWEIRGYDGTNSYVIVPTGSGYLSNSQSPPSRTSSELTIIESKFPITINADPLGVSLAQIALAWISTPEFLKDLEDGAPPPWTTVRECKENFGYRWYPESDEQSGLFSRITSARDLRMDRPIDVELQSLHSDYPETTTDFNARLRRSLERGSIPNEWVRAVYKVDEWATFADRRFPKKATLETFLPPPNGTNHHGIFVMEIDSHATSPSREQIILNPIETSASVFDYRFKTNNGTRIFPYANYILSPNAKLRDRNDPELLAAQREWLRSGRKINQFIDAQRRWVTWLFLGLLLAPVAYVGTRKLSKTK